MLRFFDRLPYCALARQLQRAHGDMRARLAEATARADRMRALYTARPAEHLRFLFERQLGSDAERRAVLRSLAGVPPGGVPATVADLLAHVSRHVSARQQLAKDTLQYHDGFHY